MRRLRDLAKSQPSRVFNSFHRTINRLEGFQNLIQTRVGSNFRNPTSNPLLEEKIKQVKINKP